MVIINADLKKDRKKIDKATQKQLEDIKEQLEEALSSSSSLIKHLKDMLKNPKSDNYWNVEYPHISLKNEKERYNSVKEVVDYFNKVSGMSIRVGKIAIHKDNVSLKRARKGARSSRKSPSRKVRSRKVRSRKVRSRKVRSRKVRSRKVRSRKVRSRKGARSSRKSPSRKVRSRKLRSVQNKNDRYTELSKLYRKTSKGILDLFTIAKQLGIKGFSNKKKEDLIRMIIDVEK
jgi:hypothetical protein